MAYEIADPDTVTEFEEAMVERINETLFNKYDIPLNSFLITANGDGDFDLELTEDIESIKDQLPTKIPISSQ
jgi:hypothetical protein